MIKRMVHRYCRLIAYAVGLRVTDVAAQARDLTIGMVYAPDERVTKQSGWRKAIPARRWAGPRPGPRSPLQNPPFNWTALM